MREYKILCINNNSDIKGCIIGVCRVIKGIKFGIIVDFILDPTCTEEGKLLVENMLDYFLNLDVEFSGILMLKHTKEYEVLRESGFFLCPKWLEPQPIHMLYKGHTEKGNQELIYKINNWFLTFGDYDII